METVCDKNKCVGCNACANICPQDAIEIVDSKKNYNAIIDSEKCVNCGLCKSVCQKCIKISLNYPRLWKQGWANDCERAISTSGGAFYAIAKAFIYEEGLVCACKYIKGEFIFDFINSIEEIPGFVGSKYVKSDMKNIYGEIVTRLKCGKKVLFIGLPCQVAGLKLYVPCDYHEYLYTIDLICHGTPSVQLLKGYLKEKKYDLKELDDIVFRKNTIFNLFVREKHVESYVRIEDHKERDRYTMAFLNALTYTDNCYECDYARIERVSDITIGDSWGSLLGCDEIDKGISLVLCQTHKGEELLDKTELYLKDVDLGRAIEHNGQLKEPSKRKKSRDFFWAMIDNNKQFIFAVEKALPYACFKQKIRKTFMKKGEL